MSRPKFLNLTVMYFPITAIASIFHRISGFFLFLSMPLLMYVFSVIKLEQSIEVPGIMALTRFLVWSVSSLFVYHSLAGVRHILADFGIAESYRSSKRTAWTVIVLACLYAAFLAWELLL